MTQQPDTESLISILIVNYNSADFTELSLYALKKLTCYPYDVYILDNYSAAEDYEKLQKPEKNCYGDYFFIITYTFLSVFV